MRLFVHLISLCVSLVYAQNVEIYHRLWDGITQPPPQFVLRSTVFVENGLDQPKAQEKLQITNVHDSDVYQVGVKAAFDPSLWLISSTKACFLPSHVEDIITLGLSSSNEAYTVDYSVHPTPRDGRCPSNSFVVPKDIAFSNTTINAVHRTIPPQPELRAPIPVSTTGEPITPPPEKSFIQKYWIYLLIAFVGIALSGGSPEDEQGSSAAHPRSSRR